MAIKKVLFKAIVLLVFQMCSFHAVSRKYHLIASILVLLSFQNVF